MWHLEAFDNGNNRLVKDYALHDMAVEIVKEILDIDDSDFELPVGIRQNDVPLEKVPEFAKYINEPFKIDRNSEFEVSDLTD